MGSPKPSRRWIWPLLGLFAGLTLACAAMSDQTTYAPYRLDQVPPFWACVTSTPLPTATPEPPPPGWPFLPTATPTPTPTPWGWPTPTATPWGWPTPTPTATPAPTEIPVWVPPNWPPTPIPTPTPYFLYGSFYRQARIWIPVRPVERATPTAPLTGPREPEMLSLMLTQYTLLGTSPVNSAWQCRGFTFEIQNFSEASALDFDLPAQVFLKQRGQTTLYHTDMETLMAFGGVYPAARFMPGETRTVTLPLCAPGNEADLMLGVMTSLYTPVAAGTGSTAPGGADTTIYINFQEMTPGCSYTPGDPGYPYPELSSPPAIPSGLPFYGGAVGGRISGNAPVSQPPCGGITRGFGCDDFPTGVSGAGRCPAELPYWHTGIDYSCVTGTPIYSPLEGVIDTWGWGGGYGNLASVTGGPLRSMYAHLSEFGTQPYCSGGGSWCEAGALIGYVGNTGFSTGPHLHWEVRLNGVPIDPLLYFAESPSPHSYKLAARALPGHWIADLAAPALVTETLLYPLSLSLRDATGAWVLGPEVQVADIEGRPVAACQSLNGRCDFRLPPGVYRLTLSGTLLDGTPVDPHGTINVAAQDRGEYLYGPLAVWHAAPQTVAGLVLIRDEYGVSQPYLDAAPGQSPQPLNPLLWFPEVAFETPETPTPRPRPVQPAPRESDTSEWWRWAGVALLFLSISSVLVWGYLFFLWRRRGGEGVNET